MCSGGCGQSSREKGLQKNLFDSTYLISLLPLFSMKELEKDMAMLRNGMKEVGREVEFYRTQPPVNGDRYLHMLKFKISKKAHLLSRETGSFNSQINFVVCIDAESMVYIFLLPSTN